jgi:hypothetical protein
LAKKYLLKKNNDRLTSAKMLNDLDPSLRKANRGKPYREGKVKWTYDLPNRGAYNNIPWNYH